MVYATRPKTVWCSHQDTRRMVDDRCELPVTRSWPKGNDGLVGAWRSINLQMIRTEETVEALTT
jgi:hypothetical protein